MSYNDYIQQIQLRSTLINYIAAIMQQNDITATQIEEALIYVLNSLKDQIREELLVQFMQKEQEYETKIAQLSTEEIGEKNNGQTESN